MTNLTKLQSLLEQAQVAVADLETGWAVTAPDTTVSAALSTLVYELGVASSELQSQTALLGTLIYETDALVTRLKAMRRQSDGMSDE